jgi:hypothetical protein
VSPSSATVKVSKHVTVKTQAAETTEAPVTEPTSNPPADETTPWTPPADPGQADPSRPGAHGLPGDTRHHSVPAPSPTD